MSSEPLLPSVDPTVVQKNIKILFTNESIQPLILNISNIPLDSLTLIYLRQTIRNLKPNQTEFHTLRFLRSGNIISSSFFKTQIANYLTLQEDVPFFIHCVIGIDIIRNVNHILSEEQQDDDGLRNLGNANGENGPSMGAIGFDRLRSVGFSDEEIELLRSQFRSTYGDLENQDEDDEIYDNVDALDIENSENGNTTNGTDIRELEEQWMENGVGDNNDRFNSVPIANFKHNMDLLIGISVGFSFGVFSFIIMKFDGLFNKRQRMSIFAGIIINMIFSFLRGFD